MVIAIIVLENPSGERMLLIANGRLSIKALDDLFVEHRSEDLTIIKYIVFTLFIRIMIKRKINKSKLLKLWVKILETKSKIE